MQKIVRVKTEYDLAVLNSLLDDGWIIKGNVAMPHAVVTAQIGKNTGFKVYGGWTDYILEMSKKHRKELQNGSAIPTPTRRN